MAADSTRFNVQLPTHSTSFQVSVPSSSTVIQLKETISETCPGRPTRAGQRVIYKGRIVDDSSVVSDIWNSGETEYTIHVAVDPNAWTTQPPQNLPPPSYASGPPSPLPRTQSAPPPMAASAYPSASTPSYIPAGPPFSVAFVHHTHVNALRVLCGLPRVMWWGTAHDVAGARAFSKATIEGSGASWPVVFDMEYPPSNPAEGEGVQYAVGFNDSLPFLFLQTPDATPTAQQRHALKVLEATLPLLNQTPLIQTQFLQQVAQALQTSATTTARALAPHLAARRQQQQPGGRFVALGGAAMRPLAQIQFRLLAFPLLMLIFRASLLLYIFSPTRRPMFALLIAAWCAWEVYGAFRAAMVIPEGPRAAAAAAAAVAADAPRAPEGGAANNAQGAPAPPQANGLQATLFGTAGQDPDLVARLANIDLAAQAAMLEPGAAPAPPPTLAQRAKAFVTLLVLSMHPAWWNRRRRALRNREGQLRTTYRQVDAEELQQEQQQQGENGQDGQQQERRPPPPLPPAGWAAAYIERVRNVEWVDE
ncbi:hypothetical protein EXIGLDRAFT_827939 [Exidia glandulosa HHB12029]|uniref:Ubiquitin-like domain-containing protein n=1 Tax=Exidia glandulosa HHB12029 TaxID=1314781 RepID=A0A165QS64_EXIGL|nr:hypothetical protein EXIGLDRAFT_827939 [Exidia glandulosa HHB12029]